MYRNAEIHKTRNLYQEEYTKIFSPSSMENHSFSEEENQESKKIIREFPLDTEPKNDKRYIPDNQRSKSNKMQRIINQIGKGKEVKVKNTTTQSTNMDDPEFHEP